MTRLLVFDRLLEISLLLQADMARSFAASGLTVARTHLLWELHQLGPSTQQRLATALQVSPRNVTGLVDALVAGGFVTRQPHPTDRRATLVTLTDLGAVTMTGMEQGREQFAAELLADVDEDALVQLGAGLDAVAARLRDLAGAVGGARMTAPPLPRPARTWSQQAAYLARRAWWMEIRGYQAMFRYVFRRPRVPAGATGFSYHSPVIALLIAFLVVSAVELVVVDLLVRRWESVRIGLLALSIWGLVWMFGLLFGMLTRPHAVGPAGLRVRSGTEIDIPLDWDAVSAVSRVRRVSPDKPPTVTVDDAGVRTLHLRMQNEANLEIELAHPVAARLPQGTETVGRIELYADQPQAYLDAVARHRPG